MSWPFCAIRTTLGNLRNARLVELYSLPVPKERFVSCMFASVVDVQKSKECVYDLQSIRPKQLHGAAAWFGMNSYFKKLRLTDLWL